MTYNRIARAVRQGYIATIAAVLVVTATGVAARAATICVDPSGKHGCLTTIQAGVTAASAGDTVFVKTGKYFETVTVPSGKDGLILQGASKTGVVIIASYPDGIDVQSNNVTIETLSIETFYYWGIVVADGVSATTISKVRIQGQIYGGYACINNGGPNTTVTKSTLNGCYYGIYTTASVGVFDSTISQCSNGCIYATADSVAIVHNTINPYGGYGIYVSGDGPEVNDNTIGPVSSYAISVSCHDSGYTTCTAASIGGNKAPGQI
ncbi:MAG TPA: right-handed parallel beta-helix repeat-containing protein, partial [Candidatus Binatia bacterium]|nr:right-handed parallel beta-helix repeat-containing protein [Candidatus Binatia bacterium]